MHVTGGIVALASLFRVLLEAVAAWRDGMLTLSQMKKKYPKYKVGLPFLYHFEMWGDLLIITPLMFWLVSTYSIQWMINAFRQNFSWVSQWVCIALQLAPHAP